MMEQQKWWSKPGEYLKTLTVVSYINVTTISWRKLFFCSNSISDNFSFVLRGDQSNNLLRTKIFNEQFFLLLLPFCLLAFCSLVKYLFLSTHTQVFKISPFTFINSFIFRNSATHYVLKSMIFLTCLFTIRWKLVCK